MNGLARVHLSCGNHCRSIHAANLGVSTITTPQSSPAPPPSSQRSSSSLDRPSPTLTLRPRARIIAPLLRSSLNSFSWPASGPPNPRCPRPCSSPIPAAACPTAKPSTGELSQLGLRPASPSPEKTRTCTPPNTSPRFCFFCHSSLSLPQPLPLPPVFLTDCALARSSCPRPGRAADAASLQDCSNIGFRCAGPSNYRSFLIGIARATTDCHRSEKLAHNTSEAPPG
ncbi:hypothetical protein L226DRAFT_172525 [Lentinus tigrinus ALCF2SS1-7]|uniref:Uncharacterized protein n=1 Tax=Lentinus tigrinus ALCF2SS1-6 TaxID=1328759 RepID=A0A5C2S020_9APHY|nr:hypothetical protein L227DRAFT_248646 [Lentinus tigrinus ALCF2SS1-6]RPD71639.1 hypothetical protein L226DRAFT_172525 [Lentinus tigrinus ALCF2SS1-7]